MTATAHQTASRLQRQSSLAGRAGIIVAAPFSTGSRTHCSRCMNVKQNKERGQTMEIGDWRHKIDELDVQIVRLISERAAAAHAIGQLKRNSALPVYEPKREQQVFDHVCKANPGPLADAELLHVYERIIDVMRTLQRRDA
jgi:chorismate mutase